MRSYSGILAILQVKKYIKYFLVENLTWFWDWVFSKTEQL